ncbi:hypothetical protein RRG08_048094 [Elysia crispata]|uniref:Uncharacterized protein n=1 Tax=Elysia crispata TaxID=231223 RepID=A0AAE1B3V6_9GAST|nr:hypothetical protein RRG08_048094 [Elysia crispata]
MFKTRTLPQKVYTRLKLSFLALENSSSHTQAQCDNRQEVVATVESDPKSDQENGFRLRSTEADVLCYDYHVNLGSSFSYYLQNTRQSYAP